MVGTALPAQAHLLGDGRRCARVVSRYHLDPDARCRTGFDRFHGLGTRRVNHALKAQELNPLLHVGMGDLGLIVLHFLSGEGQDPEAPVGHGLDPVHDCLVAGQVRLAVRSEDHVALHADALNGSLDVNDPWLAVALFMKGRHVLALGLEGYGVKAGHYLFQLLRIIPGFHTRGHKCTLGGVTLHLPSCVGSSEVGVVAQDASLK